MNKTILMIAFFWCCLALYSQSIFTFHGPADISSQTDIVGAGMGDTGVGDLTRQNASTLNPALTTTLDKTYFSTGISMGYTTYNDVNKSSFKDDQISMPYFLLAFPYKNHRFGINYTNISSANLKTEARDTMVFEGDEFLYDLQKRISLSLYQAGLFYANKNPLVNIGFGLNYLVGHEIIYDRESFPDSLGLLDSEFEIEKTFYNPSVTFGLAKGFEKLSVGVSYSTPTHLKGDVELHTNAIQEKTGDASYKYPASLAYGVTYLPFRHFVISSDIHHQFWSNSSSFEDPVDTVKMSLGLAWTGIPRANNYLAKIPLRTGFSYRNLPFKVNNNEIYETAYHFGFSLPLKQSENTLDLALKLFSRGETAKHDFAESGFLLSVGTQGFDFLKKPFDRKSPRDIPRPDKQ
ncbi:MAG: hypothetical protein FWG20_01830 [Candidatus Cloacimonetes bacterium]|nr:hypothetical protein [Candidatus Cloacimonadota bacterium]